MKIICVSIIICGALIMSQYFIGVSSLDTSQDSSERLASEIAVKMLSMVDLDDDTDAAHGEVTNTDPNEPNVDQKDQPDFISDLSNRLIKAAILPDISKEICPPDMIATELTLLAKTEAESSDTTDVADKAKLLKSTPFRVFSPLLASMIKNGMSEVVNEELQKELSPLPVETLVLCVRAVNNGGNPSTMIENS
uniref:(California timema) hypothetical protein n=1 Tax=Timema californicum TaxID=61474 RepID=A0A7R9JKJ1_TIMCA|nr:unnamed protein product [Timema californicum]